MKSQRASRLTALKQFRKHFFRKRVVKYWNKLPSGQCPNLSVLKQYVDNALNYML